MKAETKKMIVLAIALPSVAFVGWLAWDKLIKPRLDKGKEKGKKAETSTPETPKPSQQVGNPSELYDKLVATGKAKPSKSKDEFISRYNTFTDLQKNLIITHLSVYFDSRPYQVAVKDYHAVIKAGKDSGKYTNNDINAPDDFFQYIYA